VIGDVRALPFEDRAFDVAVTIDLLEHVPAIDRPLAIKEVCRVARRLAIFACPAGSDALEADRRLAQRLQARPRGVPPWLVEHVENGFPEPLDLAGTAGQFGLVRTLGNESISAHERLIVAETSLFSGAALRLACIPLEALVTSRRRRAHDLARHLLCRVGGGDRPPTYRTIVLVDVADALELVKDPR
jgi:Methyltransferase domain